MEEELYKPKNKRKCLSKEKKIKDKQSLLE